MLKFDQRTSSSRILTIGEQPLTIPQVDEVARGACELRTTDSPELLRRLHAASDLVNRAVADGRPVYGVTTGFGGMANVPVPPEQAADSQNNLLAFLAAGAGPPIEQVHVRAAMALRASVLCRGYSGTRLEIIERIVQFLNAGAIPVVREFGSIGASGDLVPLSTIARAITGRVGSVRIQFGDREVDAATALQELNLEPLSLRPKEGLAIVNGTSFSAAIAANCVAEFRLLLSLALSAQALMMRSLVVQEEPFEEFVHACKPHPGQITVAQIVRRLLAGARNAYGNGRPEVQDRYSLRCLPQYLGPIVEGLLRISDTVETEMNSVSDNPLIDADCGRFYQSGNFLGQYLGMAMDELRRFVGLLAKHLDVQIASLVAPEFSKGLPSSLRGNERVSYNMGLKGLQITGNSIMPMLTHLANPLVEHFPTHAEQFNQNINGLSWGAANLAWKSIELFQQYIAVSLLFAVQALDLRAKVTLGHYDGAALLGPLAEPIYTDVMGALGRPMSNNRPLLYDDSDVWLEEKLVALVDNIRSRGALIQNVGPVLSAIDDCSI